MEMVERRAKPRLPLVKTVRYTLVDRKSGAIPGIGQTANLSASGMLLRVHDEMLVDDRLALNIALPTLAESSPSCRESGIHFV